MTDIPWAVSSGALVARVDDVDVYLLTVEFWGDRVVVRLVAECTEAIRASHLSFGHPVASQAQDVDGPQSSSTVVPSALAILMAR